jgi:predicted heme/steroid binding protein
MKSMAGRLARVKRFSRAELARYNGKNGAPAYIACKGKIYDASNSFQWRNGRHQVLHGAGEDLTDGLEQAPHGVDLLARLPVIGILRED